MNNDAAHLLEALTQNRVAIAALRAAVRGLIASHPAPERAMAHVRLCVEDLVTAGLFSSTDNDELTARTEREMLHLLPSEAQLSRAPTR